jgi:sigma-B regulation protein RsbU (phosphoserine phosphatase)
MVETSALHALLDLSKALSAEVDLSSLISVVEEKASAVIGADRTTLTMVEGDAPQLAGSRDRLVMPVTTAAGKVLGTLACFKQSGFNGADEELMRTVASHVAVAMERALLTTSYLEHERLAEGLKLASEIQMRMLPSAAPGLGDEQPFEINAYIRPAKLVGGDLYDFTLEGNRLYFCIGDVAGKGIGAALVMALTKTLFRANVPYYEDAAKLTQAVNARLCEETTPTMFVTAFCGFLNLDDGTLLFCNAGHDRPFFLRANGGVELLEVRPGLALGVIPKFVYPLQQTKFAPGDALFLYTDGVTEATNEREELFSIERLRQTLLTCAGDTALRVIAETTNAIEKFASRAPQADDITMMCIRYRGART